MCLALMSVAESASALVLAIDSASSPVYAFEPDGAWKGQYAPTDIHQAGQNPPGTDNGGAGFGIWDFTGPKRVDGGYHNPVEPYSNLNHFIDGVDFPTTAYNDLGAPAFGLGNCNPGFHEAGTAVAERPFAQPMQVGDVFSADIDTPAEYDNYAEVLTAYPFAIIGFLDAVRLPTFGIEAGGDVAFTVYPWTYDDATGTKLDFGVAAGVGSMDPTITSDGSSISLEILSATTGRFTLDGVSLDIAFKFGLPKFVVFTLFDNNAEADATGNPTGEHAFYFNNLKLERPSAGLEADFDEDGDVDGNDVSQWRGDFGVNGMSDADNDGDSDGADFLTWQRQLGSGPPTVAASAAVPEPGTSMLVIVAAVGIREIGGRLRRELVSA